GHRNFSHQVDDILSSYESFHDDLCILILKEAHRDEIQHQNQESL
ncbi:Tol-Pal system subunit TolQ, partial [Francisella tularensis subsp. holarctica]|nr:Tol-Pal system subunit TolQ [Francisella tularensis subsp. holarctica]